MGCTERAGRISGFSCAESKAWATFVESSDGDDALSSVGKILENSCHRVLLNDRLLETRRANPTCGVTNERNTQGTTKKIQ